MGSLDDAIASIPRRIGRVKAVYAQYSPLFEKFRGGLPIAFFATIAQWESDGRMDAPGSAALGEVGVFQISEHTEEEYSTRAGIRTTLSGNFWLAGLDYNAEARRLQLKYPHLFVNNNADLWMTARLVFAIGRGGTSKVLDTSKPTPGNVFNQLVAWAKKSGGIPLGSQSAAKVAYRIQAIPVQWEIAQKCGLPSSPGIPSLVMPPDVSIPFRLPKDLTGKLPLVDQGGVLVPVLLAAVAVIGYFLWKKG